MQATYKRHAKLLVSRLLLAAYLLLLCKPVLPVLQDRMAHRFWGEFHMSVVHKGQGARHVHAELSKASDDVSKDKSDKQKTTECPVHLAAAPVAEPDLIFHAGLMPVYSQYRQCLFPVAQGKDDPPPERV